MKGKQVNLGHTRIDLTPSNFFRDVLVTHYTPNIISCGAVILHLYHFSEVVQNFLSFPGSENSLLSIPGFPGGLVSVP